MTVYVYGPKDVTTSKLQNKIVNTTSRSKNWSVGLSPFKIGPCPLYDGHVSKNMENAWQFCKVYSEDISSDGSIKESYWKWAKAGWNDSFAHRYPKGKGRKPKFSLWKNERLSYVQARRIIYIPLYSKVVRNTDAYKKLEEIYKTEGEVHLWDFDGYNYIELEKDLESVMMDPNRKMGHAFVLAMMLTGEI